MLKTRLLHSPVVTLLSPSPAASKKAQDLLQALVGLEPVPLSISSDDNLNEAFRSSLPGFSRSWHSTASSCPSSGAVIHFCSIDDTEKTGPFSLIGLSDSSSAKESTQESVQHFRDVLASHVHHRATSIKLKGSLGRPISPLTLLESISSGGLPLLKLPVATQMSSNDKDPCGLKEIVVPYFDYAKFSDGTTLLSKISEAYLARPTVGVYQWTNSSTYIRPLPTAAEDQRLSAPSLIFHCEDLRSVFDKAEPDLKVAKIGYSGNKIGQLMMLHPDLEGLDVRFCCQTTFSSTFSEAQESLLAASLDELQSTNALLGGGEQAKDDKRVGQADCWVEVRANLKRPSGYFHRKGASSSGKPRIANIPDLPYE